MPSRLNRYSFFIVIILLNLVLSLGLLSCTTKNTSKDKSIDKKVDQKHCLCVDNNIIVIPEEWSIVSKLEGGCPEGWACKSSVEDIIEIDTGIKGGLFQVAIIPRMWIGFEYNDLASKWPKREVVNGHDGRRIIIRGTTKSPWNRLHQLRFRRCSESKNKEETCSYGHLNLHSALRGCGFWDFLIQERSVITPCCATRSV